MPKTAAASWGRYPRVAQSRRAAFWASELPAFLVATRPVLAHGAGRSYGDSCQVEGGTLVEVAALDRFLAFDPTRGEITVEAGLLLRNLAQWSLPRGWRLPVTPGTQLVTVGGAIANDVHGKNHHVAGSFGRHVRALRLLRSDGSFRDLTPGDELFAATVGGLGLTGFIVSATLALAPARSADLDVESVPFDTLDDYFALAAAPAEWEHAAAWIDCATPGSAGRGLFQRGRHVDEDDGTLSRPWGVQRHRMPIDAPSFALSALAVRAFNAVYWRAGRSRLKRVPADRFLYPLDAIADWNRLYGQRGFVQFQCVVPPAQARESTNALIVAIAHSRQASFLGVLKTFGDLPSPGLLSFPRPGVTLALDFPMRGEATLALMARLEAIAREAGGALYPAKDACMGAETFRASFPNLERFRRSVDPAFSSSFWRRVGEGRN